MIILNKKIGILKCQYSLINREKIIESSYS